MSSAILSLSTTKEVRSMNYYCVILPGRAHPVFVFAPTKLTAILAARDHVSWPKSKSVVGATCRVVPPPKLDF